MNYNAAPYKHPDSCETLLICEVGSTAHGVSVSMEDDLDLLGVCVEKPEFILGLEKFETHIYRTAVERTGNIHARSEPGDLDLCVHGLRKFCSMAAKGNPTILMQLFSVVKEQSDLGAFLRMNRDMFCSKKALKAFKGYMNDQRTHLAKDGKGKDVTRPELIEKYGFDTKYAYHMLRLGLQGIEYARTGDIAVPMAAHNRAHLIAVRNGQVPMAEILQEADELQAGLAVWIESSNIPDEPDWHLINVSLRHIYETAWRSARLYGDAL